jgi:ABC-type nickel/cobalt efflux system permease component RcnA
MSRARRWSLLKTSVITVLCGIGHVMSSVVLGIIGVAFGIAIMKLEAFEGFRGNLAAWALIGFGFAYFIWGLHRAYKMRPHHHDHIHQDGSLHSHEHSHSREHAHLHRRANDANITPWILFTIFVLGPCEPLIPILMYPAAKSSLAGLFLVAGLFGAVTIATMLSIVIALSFGLNLLPLGRLERYAHALAGLVIFLSGMAVQFLGL